MLLVGKVEGNLSFSSCRLLVRKLLFPIETAILITLTPRKWKGRRMWHKVISQWQAYTNSLHPGSLTNGSPPLLPGFPAHNEDRLDRA